MPQPDRHAGRLQGDRGAGEHQDGEQDPGGRGQEAEPHRPAIAPALADRREQLDRQHRQHAGHEVEDQSAEQGEPENDRQRPAADPGRRRRVVAADDLGLQTALAVGYGEGEALAFQNALGARTAGGGHDEGRGAAVVRQGDLRFAEAEARRPLDQKVRLVEGRGRGRDDTQRRHLLAAQQGALPEPQTHGAAVAGHQGSEAVDQEGVARVPLRPAGQFERQAAVVGNADLPADQIAQFGAQADRRAGVPRGRLDRQHHLAAIAEGLQTEQREAVRHGPAQLGRVEVAGGAPVERRREAGIAGRAPVDLPARFELELKAEPQAAAVAAAVARRNQTHARVLVLQPGGGRRVGVPARRRDQGER